MLYKVLPLRKREQAEFLCQVEQWRSRSESRTARKLDSRQPSKAGVRWPGSGCGTHQTGTARLESRLLTGTHQTVLES